MSLRFAMRGTKGKLVSRGSWDVSRKREPPRTEPCKCGTSCSILKKIWIDSRYWIIQLSESVSIDNFRCSMFYWRWAVEPAGGGFHYAQHGIFILNGHLAVPLLSHLCPTCVPLLLGRSGTDQDIVCQLQPATGALYRDKRQEIVDTILHCPTCPTCPTCFWPVLFFLEIIPHRIC